MFLINYEKSAKREGLGFCHKVQNKSNIAPKEIPTKMCLEKYLLRGVLCSRRPEYMQWKHCQTESDVVVLVQWSSHLAIGSTSNQR